MSYRQLVEKVCFEKKNKLFSEAFRWWWTLWRGKKVRKKNAGWILHSVTQKDG